jgi:diguanylate cyclase (GGDEF)-like protein/PAS domain S-box-containing protein
MKKQNSLLMKLPSMAFPRTLSKEWALSLLSIKTKMTLCILVVFILSMWTLASYVNQIARADMQQQLSTQQNATLNFIASQIDHELNFRIHALENLSVDLSSGLLASPSSIHQLLSEQVLLHSLFNGGLLAFRLHQDELVETTGMERFGLNDPNVVKVIQQGLKKGKGHISQPLMNEKLNAPVLIISIPLVDVQGNIYGALSGVTYLKQSNFLERLLTQGYDKNGNYSLIDSQYQWVLASNEESTTKLKASTTEINALLNQAQRIGEKSTVLKNAKGIEVLASVQKTALTEWYVETSMPVTTAYASISRMQKQHISAIILLSILAGFFIRLYLRQQLSPLNVAAKAMTKLHESGQLPEQLPITRNDEIGQLIHGFNTILATLGQRKTLLKQILDTSSVAIFVVDNQGCITQANQRMAEMFDCSLESLEGREYVSLIHANEREQAHKKMLQLLSSEISSVDVDRLYLRSDGKEFWGHLTGNRFYNINGEKIGLVGVIADISDRKVVEEKLQLAASVFTYAREGILITAADGSVIEVNDTFCAITGYSRSELLGKNPRLLNSGIQKREFYEAMWEQLIGQGYWYGEVWNRRKNGEVFAVMQTISAVHDLQGKLQHYVALCSDITVLKEHEKRLQHIAHYDALTGLPNRVLLADRLHQAMIQTKTNGRKVAVAYLDLDGFKAINDQYGHHAGDQLLIELARSMKHALREGDTFARLGGDEFVIVMSNLPDIKTSQFILSRVLSAASMPVRFDSLNLQVSASLGVSFYPQLEPVDADQLLRQADHAMYQAKLAGKNRYHVFDAEQDRHLRGHHENLERIRCALDANEFVLHYQPKVNMRTGAVVGAEALIRWQHPEKGLLSPAAFLPVIENHSISSEVGEWVIEQVLQQILIWREQGLDLRVSINISAQQLQQTQFVSRLKAILARYPSINPKLLSLEVLETSALEDLDLVSRVIAQCHEIGIRFALDDFGTGYSSLTYLKRLPVTELKIDQSFVRDMLDDPDDLAILEGVIGMANAFRREVIAEGVESIEHGEMLLQLGCELAQGYGIARPMPAANFPQWAKSWRPTPAWSNALEVSRDDLPLLFSNVEHRAWIRDIRHYLQTEGDAPMPLDYDECRLGIWLENYGVERFGTQPVFRSIDLLHKQTHELANELIQMKNEGRRIEALKHLTDLRDLGDSMLRRINLLLRRC